MSCKLLICVVIRVDLIATEENTVHIGIALQLPFFYCILLGGF